MMTTMEINMVQSDTFQATLTETLHKFTMLQNLVLQSK